MREILFRGKRTDNGKLVYGFLADYIAGVKASINPEHTGIVDETKFCCVDPCTVSQFTGLTDKNGNRIFEGDVVNMNNEDWASLGHPSPICVVKFDKFTGGFEPFATYDSDCGDYIRANCCEVVGNIYDNWNMEYRLVCDRCRTPINPASRGIIVGYNMDRWNEPKEKYELCVSCAIKFRHWMNCPYPIVIDNEGGSEDD